MSKSTYYEKLRSPKWQKKRLEIMQRDQFCCQSCGDTESTLNVHHKTYRKNAEPWEYEDENFITYCENCHSVIHEHIEDIKQNLTTGLKADLISQISKISDMDAIQAINITKLIVCNELNYLNKDISKIRIDAAEMLVSGLKELIAAAKLHEWKSPFAALDAMIDQAESRKDEQ